MTDEPSLAEVEAAAWAIAEIYGCPIGTESWEVFEGQFHEAARAALRAAAAARDEGLRAKGGGDG